MKFSLNIQGNNTIGAATNGTKPVKDEESKMNNANTNIQLNTGTSGSLAIKNTLKLLGGLALAGMIAATATFGSVSADSPAKSTSFVATGPNEMDLQYLNSLGNTFMVHGPNAMDIQYLNKLGNTFFAHGPDVVEPSSANAFRIYGPDIVEPSSANAFRIYGPDVLESSSVSAFRIHGPDVVEPTGVTIYSFRTLDTSEWNG